MALDHIYAATNLSHKQDITAGRILKLQCPPGQPQVFLRDRKTPGLAVRATAAGNRSFVYEGKLNRKNIRMTLGNVQNWTIDQARARVNEIQVQIDKGIDPREYEKEQALERRQLRAEVEAKEVKVFELWQRYLAERQPRWSESHHQDHIAMAQRGGEKRKRHPDMLSKQGPLYSLMDKRIVDLNARMLEEWALKEVSTRPASLRLSIRLFKAFLNWLLTFPEYEQLVSWRIIKNKRLQEAAGKQSPRSDYIQREQLTSWFKHTIAYPNQIISTYLQCLLLTGARRTEMMELRWADIDFQWKAMTIRDKVEGKRTIPLTPYVAHLLEQLPRTNEWVFCSSRGKSKRIADPSKALTVICKQAGVQVTLHGLRRTFISQSEWVSIPKGVSSQIAGHKPSALAEKHYIIRPIDLLRMHHTRLESWLLSEAGVPFYEPANEVSLATHILETALGKYTDNEWPPIPTPMLQHNQTSEA